MFQSTGIEAVLFCAALQLGGAVLGGLQGAMRGQVARLVRHPRSGFSRRYQAALAGFGMRISGALAGIFALLTLLGFFGLPYPIVTTLLIANTILPVLGCALFIFPAWSYCARAVERRIQPVDVTA